jgi:hypothetical protein
MDKLLMLVELLLNLSFQAQRIGESAQKLGDLIKKARDEGRDVSDEELNALVADDDVAKAALDAAIAKAQGL